MESQPPTLFPPDSTVADDIIPQSGNDTVAEILMISETAAIQAMGGETIRDSKVERKKPSPPATSEIVLDAIRRLDKRHGALTEAVLKDIEENYDVNMKVLRPRINRFLKSAVQNGVLAHIIRAGEKEAFKISKVNIEKKNVPKISVPRISVPKVKSVPKMKSLPKVKSAPKLKNGSKRISVPKVKSGPKVKSLPKVKSAPKLKSSSMGKSVPKVKGGPKLKSEISPEKSINARKRLTVTGGKQDKN